VHPLDERRRRIGSGPLELFHPGEDRGLMDPNWPGGLRGSPSAKEGMPLSALAAGGLGVAAKAGPAIMRGGQAVVAGADKVSDFLVALMRVYKTLPPEKKNIAWRIIQEVIGKEVIEGSVDSPDKSTAKQRGAVGDVESVEFDPTGRLTGHAAFRDQQDIRGQGWYSPTLRTLANLPEGVVKPSHEIMSAVKVGGGSREVELTGSWLPPGKYTPEGALKHLSGLKVSRYKYDPGDVIMDPDPMGHGFPTDPTIPRGPGTGIWDRPGFRTIEHKTGQFHRNNARRFLYIDPHINSEGSVIDGGFAPESRPGGIDTQKESGGAFDYKEIIFKAPVPDFLTESPAWVAWNRAYASRGAPDSTELGRELHSVFPKQIYWSPMLQAHWPGEFNTIVHFRGDVRPIGGEYSQFGDEFQSDWSREYDENISKMKFLNFAINNPEKFFSLGYDGFVESGISGDVLRFLGRDETEQEGKSLEEYYKILEDDFGIKVGLTGDADEDLINIIEGSDELLDDPVLFDLSEATPLAKIAWEPGYDGPLGGRLVDIKSALRQRYQVLGNTIDKNNDLGSGDIDWHDIVDEKQDISQAINQAMEDLPKSPYHRIKDWTKLIAEHQLLEAANKGLKSISWSSADLKMKTNPGDVSPAKLKLTYDQEMKNQVIRALTGLGIPKKDIVIEKVPYNVKVPAAGTTASNWSVAETYVWVVRLTDVIIDLIINKGFKLSTLDPSKGGLLGQKTERELYA